MISANARGLGGMLMARNSRKRITAYHEAGHAVIARVLTLACGGATIRPDYDQGKAGFAITKDPYECLEEWAKRGKVRDNQEAVWHARIMTYMAGADAAGEILGITVHGDADDRRQITFMAEELPRGEAFWERLEPRFRAMTRMLVRRHRAHIERVAEALLARKTLSAKQLDKLVGRSVDDVKVNAPFLLAMHNGRS
jgi:ATP-dependent Zn protease